MLDYHYLSWSDYGNHITWQSDYLEISQVSKYLFGHIIPSSKISLSNCTIHSTHYQTGYLIIYLEHPYVLELWKCITSHYIYLLNLFFPYITTTYILNFLAKGHHHNAWSRARSCCFEGPYFKQFEIIIIELLCFLIYYF